MAGGVGRGAGDCKYETRGEGGLVKLKGTNFVIFTQENIGEYRKRQ